MPRETPKRSIPQLTGVRIIAALWVLGYHYREHFAETLGGDRWWAWTVQSGYLAVDLFFVLSGYVLAYQYADRVANRFTGRDYAQFLWKRLARIYPVHLAWTLGLVAIVLLIGSTADRESERYSLSGLLMDLTLTRTFFGGSQGWNTPAWSLSAEWFAYLAFPAVVVLITRAITRSQFTAMLWVLALVAIEWSAAEAAPSINNMPIPAIRVLVAFSLGVALHRVLLGAIPPARRERLLSLLWCVSFGALVCVPQTVPSGGPRAAVGLSLAVATIGLTVLATGGVSRLLGNRWMVFGGDISFGVYLSHIPLLMVLVRIADPARLESLPMPLLVLAVVAQVAFVLAVSAAVYRWFERPSHAWLNDRTPFRAISLSQRR
jgi:peptidoglycan/LPS O-acetylase OafA/YrhL